MTQHRIPPNSMNFTIWYNYVTDSNPALRTQLDRLLKDEAEFTSALNEEIFSNHFGIDGVDNQILETSARIEGAVSEVLKYLEGAGKDTSDYSDKVAKLSGGFDENITAEGLKSIVRNIMHETEQIVTKTRTIGSRLSDTSREINELRQNLETVSREAMTDALTDLGNRKFLDTRLREEMAKAEESDNKLCFLLLDIDHFKKFNDTYGHDVGDQVLKVVARTLKENIKGRDISARYGGEEFCIVLPETELKNAMIVAESIRLKVGKKALTNKSTGQGYGYVTISTGVAVYRKGETQLELFQRADAALYRAKESGRNKVVTEWMGAQTLGLTG